MLVVPVTVVRSNAPSVPKGWSGLILHGIFDPKEDVVPGALGQGFVKLPQWKLSRIGRKRRDEAREGGVSARVVLCHDELIRDAEGKAQVIDHGGHQGTAHDATGDEGGERDSAVRRPSPPQVTPVVACHQEWSGESPLSEALTEARNCRSKATSRS